MPAIDNFSRVMYHLRRAEKTGFDLMVAGAASLDLLGLNLSDINDLARAGV